MQSRLLSRSFLVLSVLLAACDAKQPDADSNTPTTTASSSSSATSGFTAPNGYVAYFSDALDSTLAASAIATAETKAWGCSVKYEGDGPAATAKLGEPAPAFELTDLDGKQVRLADFAGKTVVLEWFNPDCPFVKYAHGKDGPLRTMAKQRGDAVVWLAINSGAKDKQGTGIGRNTDAKSEYEIQHPILLDESGTVGRAYGATNTPHMFVIDPAGKLVYMGALDNAPMGTVKG